MTPATWEAYLRSVETGAEYVEFDIRRTRDGELVVHHDERTNHTGPALNTLSYAELCEHARYSVPKVGEVMEIIAGRAIGHLDLKETGYEDEVISLALDVFGPENFIATTLEDVSLTRIKSRFPQVRTALSLGRNLEADAWREKVRIRRSELFPLRRIRTCGAEWVTVNHMLAQLNVLSLCARYGIGAMVWTVNEDLLIQSLLADPRVDVLITDRPQSAVNIRASLWDYHNSLPLRWPADAPVNIG